MEKQFRHSFERMARNYAETAFPQNFHTRKLGEITVFFAVCGSTLARYNLNSVQFLFDCGKNL